MFNYYIIITVTDQQCINMIQLLLVIIATWLDPVSEQLSLNVRRLTTMLFLQV